jgi:dolichol-phosphate mannosyltransferase
MNGMYAYDIHGIISVISDVVLPELEPFTIDDAPEDPTIHVQLGDVHAAERAPLERGQRAVTYLERPGEHGFAIHIRLGSTIEITAAPFLRHSPHVLYTNVVEPVLRWAFVKRGYALVHGACLTIDEKALLITERTDTGKTTTILKALDAHPDYAFLAADLTLLQEDGTVLPYPKPLTISRHTLEAVHTPLLTPLERFELIFQSRVHSKTGRWFGLMLTRLHLPMASTNALVQWIIPPPKYPVQRLVPNAHIAESAHLAAMVVIERGDSARIDLDHREAVDALLANCEDSYGFPPYADIKAALYLTGTSDLRQQERHIVDAALKGHPAMLLRSETRNWFESVPEYLAGAAAHAAPQVASTMPEPQGVAY